MSSRSWVHAGVVVGLALAATTAVGLVRTVGASGSSGASSFVPMTPCRLFDTRPAPDRVGTRTTPLGPDDTYVAAVRGTNGRCTVPDTATAVSMNVTVIAPTADSFLTVYPSDASARPLAASLNWVAKQAPTPNAVTAALSADGHASFYNLSGTVEIAADVVGYYEPSGSGAPGPKGDPGPSGVTPGRVVWVATSGAPFTSVRAALASITGADTDHHTIVEVAPGTYDETGPIVLREGVDIEGAGQSSTIIRCSCASSTAPAVDGSSAAMVATQLTGDISVRGIDIENIGVGAHATGLWVSGDTFAHLTVSDSRIGVSALQDVPESTDAQGVYVGDGIVTLSRTDIEASGDSTAVGVSSNGPAAHVDVQDSQVTVYHGVVTATGISINGSGMTTLADTLIGVFGGSGSTATGILVTGADTRLTRVEASASASGTGSATGLSAVASSFLRIEGGRLSPSSAVTSIGYSSSASSADVSGLHVSASGSAQAVGVLTTGPGTLAFADLTVSTLGGPGVHDYGVEVGGNANVSIRNSFLAGTPKSVIHDPGGLGTMRIAYSRLSTPGSGTMFCLAAFDDTFAARNASCV